MKHYEIRLYIKPTDMKYVGFYQSYNVFENHTFIKSKDFLAKSWREAAKVMTEIFGADEILSMDITYMPTDEERSNHMRRKHYKVK